MSIRSSRSRPRTSRRCSGPLISITRRAAWERLDSLQSGPRRLRLGFMQSGTVPPGQDPPPDAIFHLYVDEFQAIATDSFVTMLSEARKFGLSLVLANQFLSQVTDPRIVQAILGNVGGGTIVAFRLGQADAELMEREFFPVFTRFDLANLPTWQAYMTTLINGETVRPFSLQTVPDTVSYDRERAERVRSSSRKTYSRSSRQVEAEIARSFDED